MSFLGGGIGAIGRGGGTGGETDRDELILNDPVLCPLSFSVNSFNRSVLLVCGFRSGDTEADDEDFRPNPNFFNVLFRLDLSITDCEKIKNSELKMSFNESGNLFTSMTRACLDSSSERSH